MTVQITEALGAGSGTCRVGALKKVRQVYEPTYEKRRALDKRPRRVLNWTSTLAGGGRRSGSDPSPPPRRRDDTVAAPFACPRTRPGLV